MKDGVFIINTSRGGLIDTAALIEGLKERKIGAAGLDVYEEEGEYFFEDFSNEIIDGRYSCASSHVPECADHIASGILYT